MDEKYIRELIGERLFRLWKEEDVKSKKKAQKRKTLSLRDRFLLLMAANFTCQYCGRKAPDVELQIDHKYPKSKGGKDKLDNYVVCCKECNLGKGDVILNLRKNDGK